MPRAIVPVILCGGSGSRLWPVSRQLLPKQFLPLVTGRTLLQDTVLRAREVAGEAQMIVICNEAHRFLVADQLSEVDIKARIILEPAGRNTAAAVAVSALPRGKDDPSFLGVPSHPANCGAEAVPAAPAGAAQGAASG